MSLVLRVARSSRVPCIALASALYLWACGGAECAVPNLLPTGEFVASDGLGFTAVLKLKPGGQFAFDLSGCMGETVHHVGKAILKDGVMYLSPKAQNQPSTLVPIQWDGRMYLVAKDKFSDFCNDINGGNEPRTDAVGTTFLRSGDEKLPVHSLVPPLPEPWNAMLLKHPLEGKIIKVVGQTAEANLGLDDGLKPGMRLSAWGKTGTDITLLMVKTVAAKSCSLELDGSAHLLPEERSLLWHIETGQTITSRYESPIKGDVEESK